MKRKTDELEAGPVGIYATKKDDVDSLLIVKGHRSHPMTEESFVLSNFVAGDAVGIIVSYLDPSKPSVPVDSVLQSFIQKIVGPALTPESPLVMEVRPTGVKIRRPGEEIKTERSYFFVHSGPEFSIMGVVPEKMDTFWEMAQYLVVYLRVCERFVERADVSNTLFIPIACEQQKAVVIIRENAEWGEITLFDKKFRERCSLQASEFCDGFPEWRNSMASMTGDLDYESGLCDEEADF
jgi:hypothetical protein